MPTRETKPNPVMTILASKRRNESIMQARRRRKKHYAVTFLNNAYELNLINSYTTYHLVINSLVWLRVQVARIANNDRQDGSTNHCGESQTMKARSAVVSCDLACAPTLSNLTARIEPSATVNKCLKCCHGAESNYEPMKSQLTCDLNRQLF